MTKLTTEQQTILSFHNYMNCDCQLTEDMFLVAWNDFTAHPLNKLATEYIKQAANKLDKDIIDLKQVIHRDPLMIKENRSEPTPPKARTVTPNKLTGMRLFLSRIGIDLT